MPTNHNQSYLEVPRANHRSWGLARFSPDKNAICPLKMCQTKLVMKVITVMFQWRSLIYDIASSNQHHPLGTAWSRRWCSCGKICTLSAKISAEKKKVFSSGCWGSISTHPILLTGEMMLSVPSNFGCVHVDDNKAWFTTKGKSSAPIWKLRWFQNFLFGL